jgi:four helix bundle protein
VKIRDETGMSISSYRDLKVWGKAMDLVVEAYRLTKKLPALETYGLTSQIQRSAVSVPANIAEGQGRDHLGEYLHHLSIANGSLMELETHLLITTRLSYLEPTDTELAMTLSKEVGRMLNGLIRALKTKQVKNKLTHP